MTATVIDERRRLVMPPELPARSAVTIQQVDDTTWIVKRVVPAQNLVVVALPVIDTLPSDPEWEAVEHKIVQHCVKHLAPFEE